MSVPLALARLLAGLALSCGLCSAPAPVPPPEPAADAPYDARGTLRLTQDEQALLAAADSGRYRPHAPYWLDTRAPDQGHHLLSNKSILGLVTKPQVQALRDKADKGQIGQPERDLAARLFWTRGNVLSDEDAEFLRALNPMALGSVPRGPPGQSGVSGAAKGGAGVAQADATRAQAALEQLKKLVTLDDHGDPAQKAALESGLATLMRSPTAVELAEQFVKIGKPAKISFEKTDRGGGVTEQNGVKMLQTSGGFMDARTGTPHVNLNVEYLQTSPKYRDASIASTLGHELLGHGLVHYQATAAGAVDVNHVYRNDEAKAGLVGWLVDAELGTTLADPHMWNFLKSPEVYHDELHTNLPYYAGTFSLEEMKNPVETLRARRTKAQEELKNNAQRRKQNEGWRPVIDHFVTAHGVARDKFKSLGEEITASRAYYDQHEKNLKEIVAYVSAREKEYGTAEGKKEVERLAKAAETPYFQQAEKDVAALADRLRGLTRGRKPESWVPPPDPGQLTWDDLVAMMTKDKKEHPEHWGSAKKKGSK